jgi:anti-sigma factor RsiW
MNPSDYDHPDLTAYALGELDAAESARVRQLLARSHEARLEYDRIQHAVTALKKSRPQTRHSLQPRQRETVLALGQALRQQGRVVPFENPRKVIPTLLWNITKLAAAACVTAGAFFLGQKSTSSADSPKVAQATSTKPAEIIPVVAPVAEVAISSVPLIADDTFLKNVAETLQPQPMLPVEAPAVASTTVAATSKATEVAHVKATPAPVAATRPLTLAGFTPTAQTPETTISFFPRLVKPQPVEFAGIVLSSRPPLDAKPPTASAAKKSDQLAPLLIHSWKAELASCPWDSSRRLMRLVTQIPVDQDAMDHEEASYKLLAKFDPAQVQAYRLVTEKHMAPSDGGALATRFAWYEIIPTRNFAPTHDRPALLGTMEIDQPRGSNAREIAPLKLMDRGQKWEESRQDFVFETAMVGFNQLLQGTVNTPGLNHKVVLDLAEKTKGEDTKGERAKFIQVVKQAQKAAGL